MKLLTHLLHRWGGGRGGGHFVHSVLLEAVAAHGCSVVHHHAARSRVIAGHHVVHGDGHHPAVVHADRAKVCASGASRLLLLLHHAVLVDAIEALLAHAAHLLRYEKKDKIGKLVSILNLIVNFNVLFNSPDCNWDRCARCAAAVVNRLRWLHPAESLRVSVFPLHLDNCRATTRWRGEKTAIGANENHEDNENEWYKKRISTSRTALFFPSLATHTDPHNCSPSQSNRHWIRTDTHTQEPAEEVGGCVFFFLPPPLYETSALVRKRRQGKKGAPEWASRRHAIVWMGTCDGGVVIGRGGRGGLAGWKKTFLGGGGGSHLAILVRNVADDEEFLTDCWWWW